MENFERAFKEWQKVKAKQKGKLKKLGKGKTIRGLLDAYFGDRKV